MRSSRQGGPLSEIAVVANAGDPIRDRAARR